MSKYSRAMLGFAALVCINPEALIGQTINSIFNVGSVAIGSSSSVNLTLPVPPGTSFVFTYGTNEFTSTTANCSNGNCVIPVTFTPAGPGVRKGSLAAIVNGVSTYEVPFVGVGTGPKLQVSPGIISTLASQTNARLAGGTIFGMAAKNENEVYIANSGINQVFRMNVQTGQLDSFAGSSAGTAGLSGDGGPATAALLNQPSGLAFDANGNLLIADTNNDRIRKVDFTTGVITTVAGSSRGFSGDNGPATQAQLNSPNSMAVKPNGDLLICDTLNQRIRLVAAGSGTITTIAGNGSVGASGDGGPATSAQFNGPTGIAVDGSDNVYVADVQNNAIRKISGSTISTVAGQLGVAGYSGDNGPATSALLAFPYGVAVDAGGSLYIAEAQNHVIRKVSGDASHTVSTLAGTPGTPAYIGDGGPASMARLNAPSYINLDSAGNLYFLDSGNQAIRKITASPAPVTFPFATGSTTQSMNVILSNTGTQTLNIASLAATGGFGSGGGSCGTSATLAAGQSCAAILTYSRSSSNPTSGTVSVTSNSGNNSSTVQSVFLMQSTGFFYIPVTPCRVVDTRNATGDFGGPLLSRRTSRTFAIRNSPNCASVIPSGADVQAYAVNVTVVPRGLLDFLTIYPTGSVSGVPNFSTLNSYDGRTKANAAIVPANLSDNNRSVSVYTTDDTDVILDLNGYFVPQNTASSLAYFPVPPCRVADTRNSSILGAQESRNFQVAGTCSIPATAQAYALNFTVVPQGAEVTNGSPLPFLTAWPAGQARPLASTLNATTGAVTANAAIIQAGNSTNSSGVISVYVEAASNVILDISGYFAPAASSSGGLALYNVTPCRSFDSRYVNSSTGQGSPISGPFNVNVAAASGQSVPNACSTQLPASAQSFVLNATTVPGGTLDYLALWARGSAQPVQSTLNARDAAITSNLAIVPTFDGSISSYTTAPSGLIIDLFGYFAP